VARVAFADDHLLQEAAVILGKGFNMFANSKQNGFTLLEMMVTIAVMAIITTTVVPGFNSMREKHKIRGAAETIASDLQLARSEAIKTNQSVSLSISGNGTTNWCYGINDTGGCNCNVNNACQVDGTTVRVASNNDFSNTNLTTNFASQTATFDPNRGTTNSGTTTLTANGKTVKIFISAIGRISFCSTDYSFYPNCP
jgi:type IV fimbrial biogenesis protein FimT